MKKKKWMIPVIILAVILSLILITCIIFAIKEKQKELSRQGKYQVLHINSSANPNGDSDYYVYCNYNSVYRYSLKDGTQEEYLDSNLAIRAYVVEGDWVYFLCSDLDRCELWKFNYMTEEKERLLSDGEIPGFDKSKGQNQEFEIGANEKYVFYRVNGRTCFCPIEGDFKADSRDIFELIEGQNSMIEGGIYCAYYDGICFVVSTYIPESYSCPAIFDIKTGEMYLGENLDTYKAVENSKVYIDNSWFTYAVRKDEYFDYYYKTNTNVECFNNQKYNNSILENDKIVTEGDTLVGIMNVSLKSNSDLLKKMDIELRQPDILQDVLFQLNPETGESRILYETKNNKTRIIGYQDGIVYLFSKYCVFSLDLASGEKTKLLAFPVESNKPHELLDDCFEFDWQNNYLIVFRNSDDVYATYKIE